MGASSDSPCSGGDRPAVGQWQRYHAGGCTGRKVTCDRYRFCHCGGSTVDLVWDRQPKCTAEKAEHGRTRLDGADDDWGKHPEHWGFRIGYGMELFRAPDIGFGLGAIRNLYLPALMLAAVASIGGAWAWTIASQRLPVALAGQLLMTEIVFATCFGLMVQHRLPTIAEAAGMMVLVLGVVMAINAFHSPRRPRAA